MPVSDLLRNGASPFCAIKNRQSVHRAAQKETVSEGSSAGCEPRMKMGIKDEEEEMICRSPAFLPSKSFCLSGLPDFSAFPREEKKREMKKNTKS